MVSTGISSWPNNANTWFTLSMRKETFPCSKLRIKRKPTPAFSAKYFPVNPSNYLRSITNLTNSFCIKYLFGYNNKHFIENYIRSGINYSKS